MDTEIKQRWIVALRSADYEQTLNRLRDLDGYCCLGVLCNLYDPNKWIPVDEDVTANADNKYIFMGTTTSLPAAVYDWAKLHHDDPEVRVPCPECYGLGCDICRHTDGLRYLSLSDLNDTGWTFEQIADVIEVQL